MPSKRCRVSAERLGQVGDQEENGRRPLAPRRELLGHPAGAEVDAA